MKGKSLLAAALALAFASCLLTDLSLAQTAPAASASTRADPRPIEDLLTAAQRLRDATHQMVRAPATEQREELIKKADQTLVKVPSAMVNLPTNLLIANATETSYQRAADLLEQASQRLQDAVKALAADPDSKRRNATIEKIKTALAETQRLMLEVPRKSPVKVTLRSEQNLAPGYTEPGSFDRTGLGAT